MKNFGKYSDYYDVIYREKDYPQEVRFVEKILRKHSKKRIKTVLSLGCGTGNHEILMAKKGKSIFGIDKSGKMLSIFKEKIAKEKLEKRIHLQMADVGKFRLPGKFDCAVSLFNVVGYQTENKQFEKMLESVSKATKKGGLFIFDCWHGPAVLKDKPTDRVREIKEGERKIVRITKSKLDVVRNIIEIRFEVLEIIKSMVKETVAETHYMRYWSIPELKYFLEKAGFSLVKVYNFLDFKGEVKDDKWDIFVVARKD